MVNTFAARNSSQRNHQVAAKSYVQITRQPTISVDPVKCISCIALEQSRKPITVLGRKRTPNIYARDIYSYLRLTRSPDLRIQYSTITKSSLLIFIHPAMDTEQLEYWNYQNHFPYPAVGTEPSPDASPSSSLTTSPVCDIDRRRL